MASPEIVATKRYEALKRAAEVAEVATPIPSSRARDIDQEAFVAEVLARVAEEVRRVADALRELDPENVEGRLKTLAEYSVAADERMDALEKRVAALEQIPLPEGKLRRGLDAASSEL